MSALTKVGPVHLLQIRLDDLERRVRRSAATEQKFTQKIYDPMCSFTLSELLDFRSSHKKNIDREFVVLVNEAQEVVELAQRIGFMSRISPQLDRIKSSFLEVKNRSVELFAELDARIESLRVEQDLIELEAFVICVNSPEQYHEKAFKIWSILTSLRERIAKLSSSQLLRLEMSENTLLELMAVYSPVRSPVNEEADTGSYLVVPNDTMGMEIDEVDASRKQGPQIVIFPDDHTLYGTALTKLEIGFNKLPTRGNPFSKEDEQLFYQLYGSDAYVTFTELNQDKENLSKYANRVNALHAAVVNAICCTR